MGLDMYLYASEYISGWGEEDKPVRNAIVDATGMRKYVEEDSGVQVRFNVAYWRKANAIHNWFVENVQGGTDDCGSYPVTRNDLEKLLEACQRVIEYRYDSDHELAIQVVMEMLPPTEGFFFGGIEVDEYYYMSIEDTIDKLKTLLGSSRLSDCDFTYSSSW